MSIWKIVDLKYIADLVGFQQHSNIRHSFVMPRNLVAYEFWDDVYDVCFSPDPEVRKLAGTDVETRKRIQHAVQIERSLITHLYTQLNVFAFSVGERAFQYLCTKSENYSSSVKVLGDAMSDQSRFVIQLDGVKDSESIFNVISEWNLWASGSSFLSRAAVSRQEGSDFRITVDHIESEEHICASMFVEFGRMIKLKSIKRIGVSESC